MCTWNAVGAVVVSRKDKALGFTGTMARVYIYVYSTGILH